MQMTNNEYIQHYGKLGMHWGIRRYQPYPKGHKGGKEIGEAARSRKTLRSGDLGSRKPKSRNLLANRREARIAKKLERAKKETLEKTRNEEQKKEAQRQEVERILRQGTASQVLSYKDHYTTKQLQEAADRIKWENTLKDYSRRDINTNLDRIEKYSKKLGRVNSIIKTGFDTKDNIDKILSVLDGTYQPGGKKKKKKNNNNQNNSS